MITKETGAQKSLTLSQLAARIDEDERTFGVLHKVDVAAGGTVITLNREVAAPAGKVKIKLNATQCDSGQNPVCTGRAWISGTVMNILVCR